LKSYLQSSSQDFIALTFSELERILGFALPDSAHFYAAWWANNGHTHTHAQAWLDAGYRVGLAARKWQTVTFIRNGSLPG